LAVRSAAEHPNAKTDCLRPATSHNVGENQICRRAARGPALDRNTMPVDVDDGFYERADAHIDLSNDQMSGVTRGKASASMMYATSRFNAWISACGFDDGEQLREARAETIKYFVAEYEKMLIENLDDYIENFEKYMKPSH
jgi:hypothetical protein